MERAFHNHNTHYNTVQPPNSKARFAGTTFSEVLIAVVLLGVFFASIFELNAICLRYIDASKESVAAVQLVQDRSEVLRNLAFRDLTTTSLQQLFIMNSSFMHEQAAALAKSMEDEPGDAQKMRSLYRKILARDPSPPELDLAVSYLAQGTIEQYAQVLLSTNEEIFWP